METRWLRCVAVLSLLAEPRCAGEQFIPSREKLIVRAGKAHSNMRDLAEDDEKDAKGAVWYCYQECFLESHTGRPLAAIRINCETCQVRGDT